MSDYDPDHFRFSEGRNGTIRNDSPVEDDWRQDAPRCSDCGRSIDEDEGCQDCLAERNSNAK